MGGSKLDGDEGEWVMSAFVGPSGKGGEDDEVCEWLAVRYGLYISMCICEM